MSINLPLNFEKDIQGKDTALVPIVVINTSFEESGVLSDGYGDKYIILSTGVLRGNFRRSYQQYLLGLGIPDFTELETWTSKPLLLNIPSLKESIDIRNYKISSVNLDISNIPYEGKRFSDFIGDTSLINMTCRIFWASPSTGNISFWDYHGGEDLQGAGYFFPYDDDAFQIYHGSIRRYTHDDEKVRLVVEDRSQATLHKDLPLEDNYLTEDNGYPNVPDKYKNKPIPMVYGEVDRSPCVIKSSTADENEQPYLIKLSADNEAISYKEDSISLGSQTLPQSALYFYKNDKYYNIQRYVVDDPSIPDIEETTISNFSYLPTTGEINFDYTDGNLTNNNNLGIYLIREFTDTTGHNTEHFGFTSNAEQIYNATTANYDGTNELDLPLGSSNALTDNEFEFCLIKGSVVAAGKGYVFVHFNLDVVSGLEIGKEFNDDGVLVESPVTTYLVAKIENNLGSESGEFVKWGIWDGLWAGNQSQLSDDSFTTLQENIPVFNFLSHADYNSYSGVDGNFWLDGFNGVDQMSYIRIGIAGQVREGVDDNFGETYEDTDYFDFETKIYHVSVYHNFKVDGIADKDFYANVIGRKVLTGDDPNQDSSWVSTGIPQADEVIRTIMYELDPDVAGNMQLTDEYNTWKYAFTIDKKINSKKLIEGIASASPYIPRFDNMGNFKFDLIPLDGDSSNATIEEIDVIDFSFSRTKIEDVYTSIVFKYNWDYAREEFNDSVAREIDDTLLVGNDDENYSPAYYGFEESELVIDDDRGKYIRQEGTAKAFAEWFLLWSCNQHLKMKVKLPLKYMYLEIGDLVDFDAILGGVKPYGIDYKNGDKVNGQYAYKTFLITSTNKTLEWVEIECTQMHNLENCVPDCTGDCDGDAVVDECGVCNGGNADQDCAGVCFGDSAIMCDDICGTPQWNAENCAEGCDGVPGGDAVEDNCGVCGGDGSSCADCSGVPNGDLVLDDCGLCGGDGVDQDCGCGSPGEFSIPDGDCDCDGNVADCAGVCGGSAVLDDCGVCNGDNSSCSDCDDLGFDCGESPDCYDYDGCLGGVNFYPGVPDGTAPCQNIQNINDCAGAYPGWQPPVVHNQVELKPFPNRGYATDYSNNTERIELFAPLGSLEYWSTFGVLALKSEAFILNIVEGWLMADANCPYPICKPPKVVLDQIEFMIEVEEDGIVCVGNNSDVCQEFYSSSGEAVVPFNVWFKTINGVPHSPFWENDNEVNIWNIPGEFAGYDDMEGGGEYTWRNLFSFPEDALIDSISENDVYVLDFTLRMRLIMDNVIDLFTDDYGDWTFEREYPFRINIDGECLAAPGDLNNDNGWNVLDVVLLANCVIVDTCEDIDNTCAADMNADGAYNILDVVTLINCILAQNCGG